MIGSIVRQGKLIYSTSAGFQTLVRRVSNLHLYYRLIRAKIEKQRRRDKKGPFNLVIETSNFCNANCIMCPYSLMKRAKKIMDQKTFDKIITRIKEEKLPFNKIFFSGLGEPLTDPNLVERMEAIKSLGLPVRLYTNASLLTPKISRQLVALRIDEVNVSFNGTRPRQYQKIMGLDFVKTKSNIETLIKIKKENQTKFPFIQISLIVIKENEKDIKRHLQNWQAKVESVTVSLPHEWGGGIEPKTSLDEISLKWKSQRSKISYPCRSLWHTFNLDSQGNFVVCCRDYESRYVLGNIRTHSFAQIQKSLILMHFRRLHLQYAWKKLPQMCKKCNFPYQGGIEWYLPRSID